MKKFLILALAVGLLLASAGYLFADAEYTRDPSFTVLTEAISGATGGAAAVSSTIVAGNKVLGFTFSDSAAGVCGLYDHASSASNNFGEAYVAAGGATTIIFPFPRKLLYGLVTRQQASTSRLVVYYE